jgi:hypothetical protein
MNFFNSNRISRWMLAPALLFILVAPLYAANNALDPTTTTQAPDSSAGIHIGRTHGFIGMHAGANLPNFAGEQFGQITNQLTLEKKDFRATAFGFDIGAAFKSHYALLFGWDYSKTSPVSEYRHFDENGKAITQTTHFRQMPFTTTFRYYPWKMGEAVGSYVWLPSRFLPYIAGGGGFMHYSIAQEGDFVLDINNPQSPDYLKIVTGRNHSSGVVPIGHLSAGMDISITSRFYANFEARYVFGHAHPSTDFTTIMKPLDLKGITMSGGIGVRF